MSKHKEVSPTLASRGIIDFNLHYGPFAHHWWHEISTENGSEFYPIRLGMTILTELNSRKFLLCIIMIRAKGLHQRICIKNLLKNLFIIPNFLMMKFLR